MTLKFICSAMAMVFPLMAMADAEALDWRSISPQSWPDCSQACALETISAAKSVVTFHTVGELELPEAKALVEAVERGLRVEIYVGRGSNLSEEVIMFADDIYQKWAATSDDEDTSMLGMGGCVMGQTDHPSFIAADPFGWKSGEEPALIVQNKITHQIDIVAAASVVAETEDFIECKMQSN